MSNSSADEQDAGPARLMCHVCGAPLRAEDVRLDRAGHKLELLTGLEDKDQVLWLEQALERRLGIEDKPVDGELAVRTVSH